MNRHGRARSTQHGINVQLSRAAGQQTTSTTRRQIRFVLAAALSWNGELLPAAGGFSTAYAIIGRPLNALLIR
jgi:hypothetical protein